VLIRSNAARDMKLGDARVQVLVNGTDANHARIVQGMPRGAIGQWAARRGAEGRALPCMLVGAVQATNVLLVAQLWFHIPFAGSFVTLYVGLILFLLAAVGIGLFVSSIAATMQQARLYSFVASWMFRHRLE
jgi:fructose-specific phosphotransferase system IIC component